MARPLDLSGVVRRRLAGSSVNSTQGSSARPATPGGLYQSGGHDVFGQLQKPEIRESGTSTRRQPPLRERPTSACRRSPSWSDGSDGSGRSSTTVDLDESDEDVERHAVVFVSWSGMVHRGRWACGSKRHRNRRRAEPLTVTIVAPVNPSATLVGFCRMSAKLMYWVG